jgi:proteasome accessory factor B
VAAQAWGQAVVGPVAGTALRKLETLEADARAWTPAGLHGSVLLTAREVALLPLMGSLRQNRAVTFTYQAPGDSDARVRTVSPWGLRSSGGRWFLVGFDHDRLAERTFRLSRIVGTVIVTGSERTQPPGDFDIASYPIGAPGDDQPLVATIRVRPLAAASLRRRAQERTPDAWSADVLTIEGSTAELVALVCAAGPDASVIEPPELAAAVTSALRTLLSLHAAAPGGDAP